ncbi:1105_t:CDS:2 [Funneliformis geosporum]|uniref:634_t:CDS:1 n=1 Tax=Funneliformis geosporum TaxID=1117311 RepID=A0A9W4SNG7_9GLOM|nr:1105_t:CDS:2 [Funneliformis geosporum]CAI2175821.1 634_t:CDS:2 [Funneliformis geosporum]
MYVEITPNGIKVTTTDGIGSSQPQDLSPNKDERGNVSYYQRLTNMDQRAEHWLQRLGAALAIYLRKYGKMEISKENEVLVDFPEGYVLYQHNKEYKNSTKPRHDRYLFGSAYKFRSPKEFEPHLIWLVSGQTDSCKCLYCGSGSNKSKRGELTEEKIINTRSRKKIKSETEKNGMESGNINKPKFAKTLYRRGEVVMVNLNTTGNEQHIKLIRSSDENDISILYWPGVILETRKVPITNNIISDDTNSDDYNVVYKAYYRIHLLELSEIIQVDRKALLPWLACRVKIPEGFNKSEELEPNIKTYVQAIDRVNQVSHTYTPVYSYEHREAKDGLKRIKDPSEKLRVQKYPNYEAILLGTEMIYINDYVRLTPKDVDENYNNSQKEPEYLLINSIYKHATKGIQFTGDGMLKGKLLNEHSERRTLSDYEWIKVNEPNAKYTIDLQDIAGRFYVLFPNLMKKMDWTSPKKLDERFIILGVKWK